MSVRVEVLTTVWSAGEDPPLVLAGGEHVLDGSECPGCGGEHPKPDAETLRLLAAAEDAGVVRIDGETVAVRARLDKAVQSQEDGEAAYARAQGDWVEPVREYGADGTLRLVEPGRWTGPWQHGHLVQEALSRRQRLDADDAARKAGGRPLLAAGVRRTLEDEAEMLEGRLAEIEEPS